MRFIPVWLAALFFVFACAPAPVSLNYPPLSYSGRTPITLDVVSIHVEDEYQPPLQAPNVDHLAPITPLSALHQWVDDRLRAGGTQHMLQFIIKEASVKEEKLPLTQGVKGAFTKEQASRFTGNIAIELRVYGGERAISLAQTEIFTTRSQTLPEGASAAQRDQLLYDLTKRMMDDVNAELEKNIQQYFSNYIRYSY